MEIRYREKRTDVVAGYLTYGPVDVIATGSYVAERGYCMDFWKKDKTVIETTTYVIGYLPSSPCEIKRWETNPCFVNDGVGTWGIFHAHSWPVGDTDPFSGSSYPRYGSEERITLDNQFAIELLQRTNPGRPEYSISQQAFDAVDFATMFKVIGNSLRAALGGAYLNYRFGWLQFFADLKTLENVLQILDSRIRELSSLTKLGGLRRQSNLGTLTSSHVDEDVVISSTWAIFVRGDVTYSSKIKVHGVVHWTCSEDFEDDLNHIGAAILAFKEFFDLEDPDLETAWQMLPFSWLADYFIRIGDYLTAGSDSFKFIPNDICIVYEGDVIAVAKPYPNEYYSVSGGTWKGHVYSRSVVEGVSFPSMRVDFLSWKQLAVCAALLANIKL